MEEDCEFQGLLIFIILGQRTEICLRRINNQIPSELL